MEKKIKKIMAEVFQEDINNITEDISQGDYQGWDSLNHLTLVVNLESEFNISFEPNDIERMYDFKAICEIVEEKVRIDELIKAKKTYLIK
ncbi:MAG: acyl carrier protein [Clostridiaceae bacterium]